MTLTLVYDGGCPFCRSFALRSELVGGIKDLEIRDGRADNELRSRLQQQGSVSYTHLTLPTKA